MTARGAERRRQLMDAAAGLFAHKGYDPTSVAEIVDDVGVGKGVFYWYFESKEQLFAELIAEAQHDIRVRQQRAIADVGDPLERIEAGLRASLGWFEDNRDRYDLFQMAATDRRFAPVLRRGQEVAVADSTRHIAEAMALGEIPDGDAEIAAHALLGVVVQLARTFVHHRAMPAADVADEAVAFCMAGLSRGATRQRIPGG